MLLRHRQQTSDFAYTVRQKKLAVYTCSLFYLWPWVFVHFNVLFLNHCMLRNFECFLSSEECFQVYFLSQNSFRKFNTIRVPINFDHFIGPDLDPNGLQR